MTIYDLLTSGHAITARHRPATITAGVEAPLMHADSTGAGTVHIEGHGWCPVTGGCDPVVTIDGREYPYETQGSVRRRQAQHDRMAELCGRVAFIARPLR